MYFSEYTGIYPIVIVVLQILHPLYNKATFDNAFAKGFFFLMETNEPL